MLVCLPSCADPEGEGAGGSDPSLKIYKAVGFLGDTGPDPLKNHKIQYWTIIGQPAKRHFYGVSLAGLCWPTFSGIWILSPLINLKKRMSAELDPL